MYYTLQLQHNLVSILNDASVQGDGLRKKGKHRKGHVKYLNKINYKIET